jgi:predicted DNA-binding transcriptional regulator YafY
MLKIGAAKVVTILCSSHHGDGTRRKVHPGKIWFGSTIWHPEEQWFLDAHDVDKNIYRTFAIADIIEWQIDSDHVPVGQGVACKAR